MYPFISPIALFIPSLTLLLPFIPFIPFIRMYDLKLRNDRVMIRTHTRIYI